MCVCVCAGFGLAQCVRQCVWPQNNVRLTRPWLKKKQKTLHISKRSRRHCMRTCVFQCVVSGEMMGRQMSDSSDSRREALWSTLRRREDGGEGEVVVTVSTVTSLNRPLTLSLSKNHRYSRRSEELKREIRFHVVKRFRRRNNSYQTQSEGSQVLTRGSSSGSG